jgi:MATE family multidrug resistance protein
VVFGSQGKALYIPQDEGLDSSPLDEETPLLGFHEDEVVGTESSAHHNNHIDHRTAELEAQERDLLKSNNIVTGSDSSINSAWEEALSKGLLKTSIRIETKSLVKSSLPMIITFLLQNSFSLTSIYSVGHLGKTQLAGITLGTMTANITGFAAIQGLTTCLDTLCSQAYGAGKYELVGLNFLRCSIFAIVCFLPIGVFWQFGMEYLLSLVVPDLELVKIAASYLRVVCWGIPGFILFECGKRFLQSQNCFHASTYVLVLCAPLNVFLNWLFVWKLEMGYIGAPIAITLNYWVMPLGLFIFTMLNKQFLVCWPKNLKVEQLFTNWTKMMELALPGIIMVEAEFLGFEIITLMASNLGTAELAAQSVISSICALAYQIPFSVSIVTATRVANFIGASLVDNSKICCKSSVQIGLLIGIFNSILVWYNQDFIVTFFTNDQEVIGLAKRTIWLVSMMQIFDCLNACLSGSLRGQGLQKIGGYINIFAFYCVGIPLSYILAFKYDLSVEGLWMGIICGLVFICLSQFYFVFWSPNWEKILQAAKNRNNENEV